MRDENIRFDGKWTMFEVLGVKLHEQNVINMACRLNCAQKFPCLGKYVLYSPLFIAGGMWTDSFINIPGDHVSTLIMFVVLVDNFTNQL